MIENHLIHFQNKSDFEEQKDNIKESSIVFIKDAKEIYTHGTEYKCILWGYIEDPIPEGYVVAQTSDGMSLYDANEQQLLIKI